MIVRLSVKNLAIVEDITVHFRAGMTSLTGETGAGKSILVDALGLVLGDRADSRMVRQQTERAEIEVDFDISQNPPLNNWLIENELDEEAQCNIRRTINVEGRSKAYVNGRVVPLSKLKEISEYSIDIHGQHAHQSLIRPQTQRELLDIVAENRELLKQLKATYHDYLEAKNSLHTLSQTVEEQNAKKQLLKYQVDELSTLDLTTESIKSVVQQHQQLANASSLIETAEAGLYALVEMESGAAYDVLSSTLSSFEKHVHYEPKFESIIESLNSALINIDEVNNDIRRFIDHLDIDPEKLQQLDTTLSNLQDVARKHRVEVEALPEVYDSLVQELTSLENIDNALSDLEKRVQQKSEECLSLCESIHSRRIQAAKPLSTQITESIRKLAMPAGQIEFIVTPFEQGKFSETGSDNIQILVATNPGQQSDDLAKVASGGELARISLAIQVATAGKRSVPTLIFDEVDVGIGGAVAEIVGQHLRDLAERRQIIAITHLPQVAAQAQHQLHVSKKHLNDSTHIEITELEGDNRVKEIARMLGGVKLTDKAHQHAHEMLEKAQTN